MAVYEFTPEQIAEIESARKAATNKKAAGDLQILSLYAHGMPVKQISQKTGACIAVIYKLVHKYQEQGLAMLSEYSYAAAERYTFTKEQIAEIEAAYSTATDVRIARRLKILRLRAGGESTEKVAKAVGVGQTTVRRMVYAYKDKGMGSIVNPAVRKPYKSRRHEPGCTPEQADALKNMLGNAASKREACHIRALLLWGEGKSLKDVAAATGLSLSSVYRLIRKFQDNGVAGISEKRRQRPFAAPKYRFTDQQKAEIGAMRGLVADKREAMKLEALWLRTEKKNLPEISTITGLHTQTVYDVIRKYHKRGLEGAIKDQRGRRGKNK